MTYYGGHSPQPFDGVALLNATLPSTFTQMTPTTTPALAGQPSTEALRQQAAAVIQRCYRWLETAVPVVPQVSALVPAMITAVQQYEAQQYIACLNQAVAVAEATRRLQAAVPGLPPL